MIIDFHTHLGGKSDWYEGTYMLARQFADTNNMDEILDDNGELDPQSYIKYMDRLGIDYTVAIATADNVNFVTRECTKYPRLIPFYTVNPAWSEDPGQEAETALAEWGYKGIKMYPTYHHYYPNDPRAYKVYEKAREFDVPVLFHEGSSVFPGTRMKYGEPVYFDDVAVDFPELKVVLAHSGRGFWYDAVFFLTKLHRNMYMEISGLPVKKLLQLFPDFEKNADKIIFGSDWPASPGPAAMIKDIYALPISKEVREKVMGINAARILGLG
ncbi:MAG: amidohydrolase family protein [Candidatus Saccharibacteria bacterium]